MALTYNTATGYTQSTSSALTPKLWDKLLHEQVQNKLVFKSLIGKDKGKEGSLDAEVANYPVVEKTQLNKEAGDQITMGMVRALYTTDATIGSSNYQLVVNSGFTANEQMVDNEQKLAFYYLKALIANYRDAVLIQGKITQKRSPFDLNMTAKDRVSNALAKFLDDSLMFAVYAGYSPNVFRELGVSAAVPAAHPNNLYGKDKSALTTLDTTDILDTDLLERVNVFRRINNINPVVFEGKDTVLLCVHPYGLRTLRADSLWLSSTGRALPRSDQHPIFTGADGEWAGIYVKSVNQIETEYNYAGLTISGSGTGASPHVASVSAQTMTGQGNGASDFRMNVLFGANAVARAFGLESYMERRKEDDYGNLMGFGGGFIYGDRRADWLDEATGAVTKNQSSAIVHTYSPNPNSNAGVIWT